MRIFITAGGPAVELIAASRWAPPDIEFAAHSSSASSVRIGLGRGVGTGLGRSVGAGLGRGVGTGDTGAFAVRGTRVAHRKGWE